MTALVKGPHRLMAYDATRRPGLLDESWAVGAHLVKGMKRFDDVLPATSWEGLIDWLYVKGQLRPIDELQIWGHGDAGASIIGAEWFSYRTLAYDNPLHAKFRLLKSCFTGSESLFWFRTCSAFATAIGQDFGKTIANLLDVRVAGHTHKIGLMHSGLHTISPGVDPDWDPAEGVVMEKGVPKVKWSHFWIRRTIPFFWMDVPRGW